MFPSELIFNIKIKRESLSVYHDFSFCFLYAKSQVGLKHIKWEKVESWEKNDERGIDYDA